MEDVLQEHLQGVDPDMLEYIHSMLADSEDLKSSSSERETIEPFIEDLELADGVLETLVSALVAHNGGGEHEATATSGNTQVKQTTALLRTGLVMGEVEMSAEEEMQNLYLWGSDYKEKTNDEREAYAAESAKDRRKARQNAELVRKEYDAKMAIIQREEAMNNGKVAAMVLPTYR